MTHRIVIVESATPSSPTAAATTAASEPEFRVRVEYRPADGLTPSQIGNEVARIQKCVNKIIEGTPD